MPFSKGTKASIFLIVQNLLLQYICNDIYYYVILTTKSVHKLQPVCQHLDELLLGHGVVALQDEFDGGTLILHLLPPRGVGAEVASPPVGLEDSPTICLLLDKELLDFPHILCSPSQPVQLGIV